MDEYTKIAEDFLKETSTTLEINFLNHKPYFNDDFPRDVYLCALKRGNRDYSFEFGQSILGSTRFIASQTKEVFYCDGRSKTRPGRRVTQKYLKEYCKPVMGMKRKDGKYLPKRKTPTSYDILACLTSYDPGDFQEFCDNFGYDNDSRQAEKTYKAVKNEYNNLCMLFNDDELEKMGEIQ